GMAVVEGGQDPRGQLVGRRPEKADAQHALDAARGVARPAHHVAQSAVDGRQFLVELPAQRGQFDTPTGADEQRRADTALQGPHELADTGLGNPQPLGGPPEMRLLGDGEKSLDLTQVQHRHPDDERDFSLLSRSAIVPHRKGRHRGEGPAAILVRSFPRRDAFLWLKQPLFPRPVPPRTSGRGEQGGPPAGGGSCSPSWPPRSSRSWTRSSSTSPCRRSAPTWTPVTPRPNSPSPDTSSCTGCCWSREDAWATCSATGACSWRGWRCSPRPRWRADWRPPRSSSSPPASCRPPARPCSTRRCCRCCRPRSPEAPAPAPSRSSAPPSAWPPSPVSSSAGHWSARTCSACPGGRSS